MVLRTIFLASLALVAPPSPVHAGEPSKEDVANAKSLAKEGRELRDKGKFKDCLLYTSPSPRD